MNKTLEEVLVSFVNVRIFEDDKKEFGVVMDKFINERGCGLFVISRFLERNKPDYKLVSMRETKGQKRHKRYWLLLKQ